jgi:predicted transglutaminase-like cysteine proteinase
MNTAIACVGALAGIALGMRFNLLVLVPAAPLAAVVAAALTLATGTSGSASALSIVLAVLALQIGYLAGALLGGTNPRHTLCIAATALSLFFPDNTLAQSRMTTGTYLLAPFGFTAFCVQKPARNAPTEPQTVAKTPERWNELATINAAVNRTIVPKADRSITRPWRDDATEGDCNDYALTKRSRLIDRGWPAGALLIATATIPNGEGHAVLVVVTDGGAFVLDNLLYGITPWKALPYRWHSIVSPENPQYWRRIISWLRFTPEPLFCPHAPVPDAPSIVPNDAPIDPRDNPITTNSQNASQWRTLLPAVILSTRDALKQFTNARGNLLREIVEIFPKASRHNFY